MSQVDARCSRRDVLKLATCSSLVTVVSGLSAGCGLVGPDLEEVAQRMIETLNHRDRASEIGEAYMAQAPDIRGQTREQLAGKLLDILGLDAGEISHDMLESLEDRLGNRVRRDFLEEDVVILGRWMLSRTETLLCVLAAAKT